MDNQQETSIAWLAGILDGEGWIGFNVRRKHHTERGKVKPHILPWITVQSTTFELVEKCVIVCSSIGIESTLGKPNHVTKANKPVWAWHLAGSKRVGALLPLVLPHLTCKRKAAENVLAFIGSRSRKIRNVTYTEQEWSFVQATREGSSETTREAPSLSEMLSWTDLCSAGKKI